MKPEAAAPAPSSGSTAAASSATPAADSSDPCDLLTDLELEGLAGGPVSAAKAGLTGGLANCQWATADGGFVQAIGAASPDWARSLPDAVRAVEASGLVADEENMKKLRAGAALVEAGQDLDPLKACSLFSEMLELQGRPEGSHWIVTVAPTRDNPLAVSGQMCSGGRFTSVMVGNQAGLVKPLPKEQVAQALNAAHRKNLD